uniref:riboflavin kinase n=1 Tax=Macrostomum lignano TaxID=282301 RepID=A0A1I8FJJ2_9PLAT
DAAELHSGQRSLDSPFLLSGRVVPGFRRGRALGCPTANMPAETLAPGGRPSQFGVFCGWAALAGEGDADSMGDPHPAVLSWGVNPAVRLGQAAVRGAPDRTSGDLYGRRLLCLATHRLRDERNFPGGLDELRRAIELDMATACRLLADRTPAEAAETPGATSGRLRQAVISSTYPPHHSISISPIQLAVVH